MANAIRYSTTGDTQSLKSGNFYFGVGDVGKGPSSATTYYNGSTPSASGYTVYSFDASQPSRISYASPTSDSEFISITNVKSGQNFTGITQCLNWYATQTDHVSVNKDYEPIVSNGLVLNLDASYTPSYTSSGTTWYDLAYSGYNNSLVNGLTYSSQYGGGLVFDNTNDYIQVNTIDLNAIGATRNYTICFSCIKEFIGTGGNSAGDSALIIGGANGYDSGWRIRENNGGTPGAPFSGRHSFTHGAPTTTNSLTVNDGVAIHRPVYLCFSINTGTTFGYCNGAYVSGVTGSYVNGSTYGTIGLGTYGVGYWGGKVYNYQLYNRSLSLSEVKQNYLAYLNRFVGKNIVTNGLTLYLDAGYRGSYPTSGTTWADIGGNNLNGTLTNGPTYSTDGGGSIVFDGVDDYCTVQDSTSLRLTNNMTLSSWFKFNLSASSQQTLILKENYISPTNNTGYILRADATNKTISFVLLKNSINSVSASNIQNNAWYNVISTYDGSQIKIYINGVLSGTTNYVGGALTNNSPLYVGQPTAGFRVNGNIANTQIYDRSLTQSEVLQNYQAQLPTIVGENFITNGLVLYLDASYRSSYPTTGTTWNNVSGVSGGTNTLVNGPVYSGTSGGTITFDGVDDYADFNAPNLGTTTTVEMWCKIGSGYSNKMFFGWNLYDVYCESGNIGYNTSNSDVYGISSSVVSSLGLVNNWKHYVFEMRSGVSYTNNKIYINGVPQTLSQQLGSEDVSRTNFNNGNGRIALWRATNSIYNMPMECAVFKVYNRALTQNEINQNFNATKSRFGI
jgi:hypothetical protein